MGGAAAAWRLAAILAPSITADSRTHVTAIGIGGAVRIVRIEVRGRGKGDELSVARYRRLMSPAVVSQRGKSAHPYEGGGVVAVHVAAIDIVGVVRIVRIEVRA